MKSLKKFWNEIKMFLEELFKDNPDDTCDFDDDDLYCDDPYCENHDNEDF